MKKETIVAVLASEGVTVGKSAAAGYILTEDREAVCFLRGNADAVTIERLARIELRDDCCVLETSKGERYFFGYEDVLGLRMIPEKKERAPGFGR
jgi:hypothetical protein